VPRFPKLDDRMFSALWAACVAGLSVVYASTGDGAWARRSAIGWMTGAWGARLAVQALYTRASGASDPSALPLQPTYFRLLTLSLCFSLPALIASRNGEPTLSFIEMAAGALWVVAFTAETTADRQYLRFTSVAQNAGLPCRAGLWKFSSRAHAICEVVLWTSFALFASASPWGWIAFACPAVMLVLLLTPGVDSDAGA
jgi:steroid 5-alpha reductase family enzyme